MILELVLLASLPVLDLLPDPPDPLGLALELGLELELAVVGLGASLYMMSPTITPVAGVTGAVEPLEFWYATLPASCAAEVMFQPFAFITG